MRKFHIDYSHNLRSEELVVVPSFVVPSTTLHVNKFHPLVPVLNSWTCWKKGIGFWFEELKGQQIHFITCPEGLCTSLMSCSSLKFGQDQLLAFTLLPSFSVPFYSRHVLPRKTDFNQTISQTLLCPPAECILQPSASLACIYSAVFSFSSSCFPNSLCVDCQSQAALSQREKLCPWSCCFGEPSTVLAGTLCRGLLLKSLHRHLSMSKVCVLQSSPAFCGPGLYTVVGKWLNSLAYCIVAILQFNSLLIPVLSPHFLSNELRLLLKISPSFSFMAVLTISHLIYEGSSVAKSCRIFLLPWFWPITPLLYKTVLIYKSEHNSVDRTSQQPLITLMINVTSVISLANFSMLY